MKGTRLRWLAPPLFVLLCTAAPARAQRPLNLDFELPSAVSSSLPWGWLCTTGNKPCGPEVALDTAVKYHGKRSLRIQLENSNAVSPSVESTYINDAKLLAAKRIRLSGWIRTANLQGGKADISVKLLRKGQTLIKDLAEQGPTGSSPWKPYVVDVPIDSQPLAVQVSVRMSGVGSAWFDNLALMFDEQDCDALPTTGEPLTRIVADALRHAVVPFRSVDPGKDFSDLAPLKAMICDAHIVSLGEATHGTSEFFRMKHRLIEYFAREMGFTVVAIEANQLQAERVNHYVLTGEGDARTAIAGLFAIWRTREMLDLIEWMRRFNASGQGRLEFVGLDMQDPLLPIDSVLAFLARADPEYVESARKAYGDMRAAWQKQEYPDVFARQSKETYAAWERQAKEVLAHVESRQADYIKQTGDDAAAWAVQNARVAMQSASFSLTRNVAFRDSCMAANVMWNIKRRPSGTRIIIWAHNTRVGRRPAAMLGSTDSVGAELDRVFGAGMRVLGLTTYEGTYTAFAPANAIPEQRQYSAAGLFTSPPQSVEGILHPLGAYLFLNLQRSGDDPVLKAMSVPRLIHHGTATKSDWPFLEESVSRLYDILVFIDRTHATTLLPCPTGLKCPN